MSSIEEENKLIQNLSVHMADKLRLNCHKSPWSSIPLDILFSLLKNEVKELEEALNHFITGEVHHTEVVNECADVANFCAMIVESVQPKITTKTTDNKLLETLEKATNYIHDVEAWCMKGNDGMITGYRAKILTMLSGWHTSEVKQLITQAKERV